MTTAGPAPGCPSASAAGMSVRVRCRALDVDLADVVNVALAGGLPLSGLRARLRPIHVKVQLSATLRRQ